MTADKTSFGGSFATSEVNTGFIWVDDKTIYKKTINIGSLPNNNTSNTAHGISNLENVIHLSGWAKSGTVFLPLPSVDPGATNLGIRLNVNGSNIQVVTGVDRTAYSGYVTLLYTKTV